MELNTITQMTVVEHCSHISPTLCKFAISAVASNTWTREYIRHHSFLSGKKKNMYEYICSRIDEKRKPHWERLRGWLRSFTAS